MSDVPLREDPDVKRDIELTHRLMNYYRLNNGDHLYRELRAHAAAVSADLAADNARLREALEFVERWANHHGAKPHTTPQEALSVIQHYPPIVQITKGYKDGKVPNTPNPWAERDELRADAARYRWLRDAPASLANEPIRKWLWDRPFGSGFGAFDAAIDAAIDAALKGEA
jgi:hypothetical protein